MGRGETVAPHLHGVLYTNTLLDGNDGPESQPVAIVTVHACKSQASHCGPLHAAWASWDGPSALPNQGGNPLLKGSLHMALGHSCVCQPFLGLLQDTPRND